jgi:hypothetical protein
MKRTLSALVVAGTLALTGCAQAGGPTGAPGPSTGAPGPSTSPPGTVPSSPIAGCTGTVPTGPVVLGDQDNGRALCVPNGTHLEIYLHGSADDKWSVPVSDNDVLRPEPSGKGALMVGVTGAFFVADHAGVARVTATRHGVHYEVAVRVR